MKDLIRWATVMLTVTLVVALMPTEAEGEIYEDTLRLHILANSDEPQDQEIKLELRDRILRKYGELLRLGGSVEDAKANVSKLLPEIEKDASEWICEMGYGYRVSATLGIEWYETRDYERFSLPAGYYSSLRIIIGEGEGQNWWCVMYPPLCTELACEAAPADDGVINYSTAELKLIKSGKYQVKFKILEELSRVFSKNG